MKLLLHCISICLWLAVCFHGPSASADPAATVSQITDSVRRVMAATVQIESRDELSSGVIISPAGHVLTVAHGFSAEADTVNVRLSRGSRRHARVLVRNAEADVAVLQLQLTDDQPPLRFLPLAGRVAQPLRLVLACGFPAREGQTASAVVRCGQLVAAGKHTIRSSCMLTAGDSGGPLVDTGGAVLGIHQRIGLGRNANLHVTLTACADAVKDHLDLLSIATTAAADATASTAEATALAVSAAAMDRWENSTVTILTEQPAAESESKSAPKNSETAETVRQLAWGTVFSPKLVVTKFSSLPPNAALMVKTQHGVSHAAHIIQHSRPLDLAVLQLKTPLAETAALTDANTFAQTSLAENSLQIGQLTFANRAGDIGILARTAHQEPGAPPKLGCGLQQAATLLTVDAVSANSTATDMELQVGDQLQSLNDHALHKLDDVTQVLESLQPGDRLTAELLRQEQRLIRHGQLRHAPATLFRRVEFLDGHAGTLSPRRTGFADVLQHDAALSADQMGGPICDLQGRIIGVNIARRARESMLAVPLSVVYDFVAPHLSSAD